MKNFSPSVAFTRNLAIFLIVTLHVTDAVVNRTNYFGGISWFFAEYLNTISRIGVPIFIMVSGYLLLPEKYSFKEMKKRAIFRILIPFLIWFTFYFYFRHLWFGDPFDLRYLLNSLFFAKVDYLYFLLIIMGLYLISPWLNSQILNKSQSFQLKAVFIFFVYGVIFYLISYFFQSLVLVNFLTIFTPYIGYFVLGAWLKNKKISRNYYYFSIISFLMMTFISAALTFINWKWFLEGQKWLWNNGGQYFGEYLSPNIILMSILGFIVFILPAYDFLKNKLSVKILKMISLASFGIYLIHPMIMDLLDHFANLAVHEVTSALWLYIVEKILLVFLISFLIAFVIAKLPGIKIIMGEYKKG